MWWDYHLSVDPICQSFDAKTSFKILMLLGYEVNLWWDLNERCSIMNYFDRVFFSWRAQLFMCVNFGMNFNFVMYFTIYEIQIFIVFVIYVISRNLSSIMFTSSNFKTFFDDEYCDDVIFVTLWFFADGTGLDSQLFMCIFCDTTHFCDNPWEKKLIDQ